jgi:hypothetical protein
VSAAYDPPPPPERPAVAQRHAPAPTVGAAAQAAADRLVRAPVRIADAGAVRLLRPGDLVDVLAAGRVVASGVSVVAIPQQVGGTPVEAAPPDSAEGEAPSANGGGPGGALVVLSVPRGVAAALSGAAASNPLAVTLC